MAVSKNEDHHAQAIDAVSAQRDAAGLRKLVRTPQE
jgi:hypothetical protein